MPLAYLPSPASGVWHLGSLPVRAYALCMVAGVVTGLWLTGRRYRSSGGQPGVILDVAAVAVPVGLIGARLYSVATNFQRYFGPGRDWTDVLRVWDGGMGVAGAVAAGALATWAYCRWSGVDIGPIALAAAPALAVAQAISLWGNWFTQQLYGPPSSLPWAVAIAPQHRAAGYQSFATFQPVFVYQCLVDLLIAAVLSYAIHRYLLSGDRAFALYGVLYAAVGCAGEAVRIDYSPRMFGLRANVIAMLVIFVAAGVYLALAGHRRRRRLRAWQPDGERPAPRPLRARSSRAAAGPLGVAASLEMAAPLEVAGPLDVAGPLSAAVPPGDTDAAGGAAGPVTGTPLKS